MEKIQEQIRQSNMDAALKIAKEGFAKRDPKDMAERAGGEYESASCANSLISLRLLGQEYTLVHRGGLNSRPSQELDSYLSPASLPSVHLQQTLAVLFSYKDIPAEIYISTSSGNGWNAYS